MADIQMHSSSPIYNQNEVVPLPSCMYTMKPIYDQHALNFDDGNRTNNTQSNLCAKDDLKELESRQNSIIEELKAIQKSFEEKFSSIKLDNESLVNKLQLQCPMHDVAIHADPKHPPYSLLVLKELFCKEMSVLVSTHIHSSLNNSSENLFNKFWSSDLSRKQLTRLSNKFALTLIWKHVEVDPVLIVNPLSQNPIVGEANIIRYLIRILGENRYYNEADSLKATNIDGWLDKIHALMYHGNKKQRDSVLQLANVALNEQTHLVDNEWTVADLLLWSSINIFKLNKCLPSNVDRWFKSFCSIDAIKMNSHVLV